MARGGHGGAIVPREVVARSREAVRDAIGEAPEPPPGPDHFLRFLVTVVDKAGFEVGVTSNVGGLLISDPLVGYAKYVEASSHNREQLEVAKRPTHS